MGIDNLLSSTTQPVDKIPSFYHRYQRLGFLAKSANACIELWVPEWILFIQYLVLSVRYAVCGILSALFSIKYCQIGCNAPDDLTVESW